MKSLLIILTFTGAISTASFFSGIPASSTISQRRFNDSLAAERQRYINLVLKSIDGKEQMQADSVFHNIQTFTGKESIKAEHFLAVMNYWGEALGVSCTHCHTAGSFASDKKQTKLIARQMYALRHTINLQLRDIKGLKTENPLINCGTCHGGKIKPGE
jgi:hypothetical protein